VDRTRMELNTTSNDHVVVPKITPLLCVVRSIKE
jgi:hypothetical protein